MIYFIKSRRSNIEFSKLGRVEPNPLCTLFVK